MRLALTTSYQFWTQLPAGFEDKLETNDLERF
jgi:hypothetical protein